jgi:hypothetical protein
MKKSVVALAALLAMLVAVPVSGATTAPVPSDALEILWQDFCARRPDHPKCVVPAPSPTATPAPTSTPTPTTAPTPTPAPTANLKTVTVTSVGSLLSTLADNTVDVIVVKNGTYRISRAALKASNSLWIGSRYNARTRPILVKAETRGGVTFDGGGTTYFGCISFEASAHHQTWDGFNCAGGQATSTGVITFGGYPTQPGAPHHITLKNWTIKSTATGRATSASGPATDHGIYIANAPGGPNNLLFEDITVDGSGGLASAFHFYHSSSGAPNAWNVTIRRLKVYKTQQAIMLWDPTLKNITVDTATITNALKYAVRYETKGATGIVLKNITSTGSGSRGFYSSQGSSPAGISFSNNSFN